MTTTPIAKANIQVHSGRNIAITAPIPKAIKNNPIVFLKAPKNIISPLPIFFTIFPLTFATCYDIFYMIIIYHNICYEELCEW